MSADREPTAQDNPRHWVYIADTLDGPMRRITARNPGEEEISVDGVSYAHTGEDGGRWVYTKAGA